MSEAKEEKAVKLLAKLYERRNDLQFLYGEAGYRERVSRAVKRVREHAAATGLNCTEAALAVAKDDPTDMVAQFSLVAALEISEAAQ